MKNEAKRGSEKLMAAWKARALTEASVREIATALDKSPAKVESVNVVGGSDATGLQISLSYEGDDTPWCGNDILFWLRWHRTHGSGGIKPPRILINGIPFPDLIRVDLEFGHPGGHSPSLPNLAGELSGGGLSG